MSILSLIKPILGQPDATQDPKIVNALTAIETWANGNIDTGNLSATAGITEGQLSAAVKALLAVKVSGLTPVEHAASAEVKAGELFVATKALTATLPHPKPTVGTSCGVWNFSNENVKVKTVGGNINGDFSVAPTEVTLAPLQHLTFIAISSLGEGGNWLIVGGEPVAAAKYTVAAMVASGVELEPNPTRPTQVVATVLMGSGAEVEMFCGGVRFSFPTAPGASGANQSVTFICPAGVKWKWVQHKATVFQVEYSYLSL